MLSDDFFITFLTVKGYVKPSKQKQVSELMTLALKKTNELERAITKKEFLQFSGLTQHQFYYAIDGGLSALWILIHQAGMYLNRRLSPEQREFMIRAIQTQGAPTNITYPEAMELVLRGSPARQSSWPCGFVYHTNGDLLLKNELTGEITPWTGTGTPFLAEDWELALPDRPLKES